MLNNVRNKSTTELDIAQFALRLHDASDALLEGISKFNMHPYFNDKVNRKALSLRKMAAQLGYALFDPDEEAFESIEATIETIKSFKQS